MITLTQSNQDYYIHSIKIIGVNSRLLTEVPIYSTSQLKVIPLQFIASFAH
jgi:hypothetical protein